MAKNTPESPLICERYKSGCAWRLYKIFDFRKGHSRRNLLSNRQHNSGVALPDDILQLTGAGTQDVNRDLLTKRDEKYPSGDTERKRAHGCKSISSVQCESANVRKKKLPSDEGKDKGAIVGQKLIDGSYQAKDQAIHHQSKHLVNALQILYSNKELFVDILHDPNSLLVKESHGSQDSQTNKMKRKKLLRSNFETRLPELERSCVTDPKELSKSIASYSSRESCEPQSSETIVVLKPGQVVGRSSEDKMRHSHAAHSFNNLSYKENKAEECNFAQMKRKLECVRQRREDLKWMAINGESPTPCSCHGLEDCENVQSRGGVQFDDRSSVNLSKRKEKFEGKGSESRTGHGVTSSKRVSRYSKFSSVRHTEQTDLELSGETIKHHTEQLCCRKDSEESTGALVQTNFSPEFEWSNVGCKRLGREATNQVRFSPYSGDRVPSSGKLGLKGRAANGYFDPLRQNMDNLSWVDTKNQNFRFKEIGADMGLSEDPLEDKVRRDCGSSIGHLKTTITNISMRAEQIKDLEVPWKPSTCYRKGDMQRSDSAKPLEGVGVFVDSPSGFQSSAPLSENLVSSSSTRRTDYTDNSRNRAEKRDEQDQRLCNQDFTRPPSSITARPAEEDNCEMLHYCDPSTLPVDGMNRTTSMSTAEFVKASLKDSILNWDELLFKFQSADQILGGSLFNDLKRMDDQFSGDRRILFDYINEVLVEVFQYCFSYAPWVSIRDLKIQMLMGERILLLELKKRVEWLFLQQQPPPSTLELHVEKDLAECKRWLNTYADMESIGTELEGELLEDVIIEIVSEMLT